MADQSRRLPLQRQISETAVARGIDVLSAKGLGLPCTIKTVNDQTVTVDIQVEGLTFPAITVPIAEPLYSRAPYQVGDAGVILSVDAALSAVSGLTAALPPFQATGNLGAAFFFPISNRKWPANPDTTMYLLQGPNGFLIRSLDGSVYVKGDKRTALTMAFGAASLVINSTSISLNASTIFLNGAVEQTGGTGSGSVNMVGPLTVTNEVTGNTVKLSAHVHSGVQTGGGDSGPPVPGT